MVAPPGFGFNLDLTNSRINRPRSCPVMRGTSAISGLRGSARSRYCSPGASIVTRTLTLCWQLWRSGAGRGGGLILTSSRSPLQSSIDDPPYQVVSISDVLTNDVDQFAIDRALAMSPYVPAAMGRGVTAPIYLSPDGRTLVINGAITVDFKSKRHIAIIRRLVAGHDEGRRFRASELLDEARSGVTTLRRAFGAKKWSHLEPYLKSKDGLWAFDL